jgi:hypothetical protein
MNCCNHNCNEHLPPRVKDMSGQRFGRLVVVGYVGRAAGAQRAHKWACRCDCGAALDVCGAHLRAGATRSCGCLQREKATASGDRTRTHGLSKTSTYAIWRGMLQRCHNATAPDYARYGAAGVKVCERWGTFEHFLADMGPRPDGMSIDRYPNRSGNYEPGNCRWATVTEQNRNTKANVVLTHAGTSRCIAEWAQVQGISVSTLGARMRRGWSAERALTAPVDRRFSHG